VDSHPKSAKWVNGPDRLRYGTDAGLCNYSEQLSESTRDSYEAANLSDAVNVSVHVDDSRDDNIVEDNADDRPGNVLDRSEV
jgi:hypothetical protein